MTDNLQSTNRSNGPTRRRFLAGVAAAAALAACSSSDLTGADGDASDGDSAGNADAATGGDDTFTLVQRFPNNVQVPGNVRLPISLSTGAASFITDGPETLGAQVVDFDGNSVGDRITAAKRNVEPAPYYDFRTTIDEPGIFALVVDGGPSSGAAFQIMDPESVAVPSPGDLLPGFDTPTTGDDQGFDAICTRTPEPCPFHTLTLAEALNVGRPVAYYVGTPAFCSTGSCAPALESLINSQERFGDVFTYVHAEVYVDDAATVIAPAVDAVGMTYEPALFITDAAGIVQERLDAVWDQTELDEALARVAG